jgi:hypothetical protein
MEGQGRIEGQRRNIHQGPSAVSVSTPYREDSDFCHNSDAVARESSASTSLR